MSTVNVKTESLQDNSSAIKGKFAKAEDEYKAISNLSILSCDSFESFKSALKSKYSIHESHVNKICEKSMFTTIFMSLTCSA